MPTTNSDDLIIQFRETKQRVKEIIYNIGEKFNMKLADNSWSVSECITHLIITGRDYQAVISDKIDKAKQDNKKNSGEMKLSLIGKFFTNIMEPTSKTKSKAPEKWRPENLFDPGKTVDEYNKLQDDMINMLINSKGLNISEYKINSPALKILRLNLLDAFNIVAAHQRRHIFQAEKVLKKLESVTGQK